MSTISLHRALVCTTLAAAVCGAALLGRFPPDQYSFYPQCPIYTAFHFLCPGCGATRALAALLHGRIAEAYHQNALFVLLLPFLLGYATLCAARAWHPEDFHWHQPPRWLVSCVLALAAVFTLVRNLNP